MNTPTPTPTPRTDAATYPADCLGKTLVTNRDCPRELERELGALTAERDQLRAAQKACEACDEPTAFEVRQLRAELATERARLDWLMAGGVCLVQHSEGFHVCRLNCQVSRADIDSAMKEDAQ
ncbi:hypothetical protein [Gemmatimonas sp.]|uniref:hypothetical protein n=1 Tax=Gemmatimonas sp. TaxID=1962908 RepID=UPI0033406273